MCGRGEGGQGWAGLRNVGGTGWLRPARAPHLPLGPSNSLIEQQSLPQSRRGWRPRIGVLRVKGAEGRDSHPGIQAGRGVRFRKASSFGLWAGILA